MQRDDGERRDEAPRDGGRLTRAARAAAQGLVALAAIGAIAAGAAGGVALLEERAAASRAETRPGAPLKVATAAARFEDGYEIEERYVGRVTPRRAADLAFERGGRVTAVTLDVGEPVREGGVVAQLDTDALETERARLQAELRRLAAEKALAERTTTRRSALADRGFSSNQSFDEARFRGEALEAQMDAVRAQLRQRDIDIAKSTLRAPFPGVITARRLDEGAVVAAGTAVVALEETGRPEARVGAPPETAAGLAIGARLDVEIAGRRLPARLRAVTPNVDPAARTVELVIDIDAAEGAEDAATRLPMGALARVSLRRRIAARGVWLPLSALKEGREGLWTVATLRPEPGGDAYVVGEEAVRLLHAADGRAYVDGTLAEGALVIAAGVARVARGQRVAP